VAKPRHDDLTVTLAVPIVVGVPVIAPAVESNSPAGSEPEANEK
jgi:hypothetical protein